MIYTIPNYDPALGEHIKELKQIGFELGAHQVVVVHTEFNTSVLLKFNSQDGSIPNTITITDKADV